MGVLSFLSSPCSVTEESQCLYIALPELLTGLEVYTFFNLTFKSHMLNCLLFRIQEITKCECNKWAILNRKTWETIYFFTGKIVKVSKNSAMISPFMTAFQLIWEYVLEKTILCWLISIILLLIFPNNSVPTNEGQLLCKCYTFDRTTALMKYT